MTDLTQALKVFALVALFEWIIIFPALFMLAVRVMQKYLGIPQ